MAKATEETAGTAGDEDDEDDDGVEAEAAPPAPPKPRADRAPHPATEDPGHRPTWLEVVERGLLYVLGAVVLAGMYGAYASAMSRADAFRELLVTQMDDPMVPDLCAASVLVADHALTQTSELRMVQLVLGAVLCMFGGFFVIKGVQATYRLGVQTTDMKTALATTSPGLVLITLAVALMALATREPMKFSYSPPTACLSGATDVSGGIIETGGMADARPGVHPPPLDEPAAEPGLDVAGPPDIAESGPDGEEGGR